MSGFSLRLPITTSSPSRKTIERKPSHLGSYIMSGGIALTGLASMGFTGGMTGRSMPPVCPSGPTVRVRSRWILRRRQATADTGSTLRGPRGVETAVVSFQQDAGVNHDPETDPVTGYPDACAAGTLGVVCATSDETDSWGYDDVAGLPEIKDLEIVVLDQPIALPEHGSLAEVGFPDGLDTGGGCRTWCPRPAATACRTAATPRTTSWPSPRSA